MYLIANENHWVLHTSSSLCILYLVSRRAKKKSDIKGLWRVREDLTRPIHGLAWLDPHVHAKDLLYRSSFSHGDLPSIRYTVTKMYVEPNDFRSQSST